MADGPKTQSTVFRSSSDLWPFSINFIRQKEKIFCAFWVNSSTVRFIPSSDLKLNSKRNFWNFQTNWESFCDFCKNSRDFPSIQTQKLCSKILCPNTFLRCFILCRVEKKLIKFFLHVFLMTIKKFFACRIENEKIDKKKFFACPVDNQKIDQKYFFVVVQSSPKCPVDNQKIYKKFVKKIYRMSELMTIKKIFLMLSICIWIFLLLCRFNL